MIFGWLWCLQAVAEPLHIEVQGLQKEPEAILHVRGESISVPLQSASAQIWTADTDVPWQRFLHLHLRNPVSKETLYRGILERKPGETSIYLGIDNSGEIINEFSSAGTQHRIKKNERNWLLARVAWFALVLAMAAWFFRGSSPVLQRKRESHLLSWWSTPLFFLLMSLGWNGTALFRPGVPGLHFDTLGTYWFMSRAQEWSWFVDPLTAWPEGANYGQLDSFVLYGLVHMLGWLSAEYLFKGILLVAPIVSAWAASRFAEELGAKRPWSWIAGIAYGFNGLAAATVLEGHVYHLLQPWLPLCAMWWWKTLCHGTKKDAVLAAIFWGLCLLTSAYIGLSASLVIFAFWIGHKGWKQPQSFWGLGVILGIFLLYFSLYRSSPGMSDGRDFNSMMVGALNLGNFFGHRPMIDHSLHSQALGVLAIPLFLAVHAFDILPRRSGRRVLWGTAFLSLSFAFGSFVTLDSLQPIFPLPLFFLGDVPLLGSIGFPIRLAWP
ncbi:MAG: hypothetical protein VX278_12965, partial [Myxococcota bacterium]|nr:hypothetical protein [Myxococcota bacterium]